MISPISTCIAILIMVKIIQHKKLKLKLHNLIKVSPIKLLNQAARPMRRSMSWGSGTVDKKTRKRKKGQRKINIPIPKARKNNHGWKSHARKENLHMTTDHHMTSLLAIYGKNDILSGKFYHFIQQKLYHFLKGLLFFKIAFNDYLCLS